MAVVGKIVDRRIIVEQTYPCLKEKLENGTVVLFESAKTGVVVVSGCKYEPVGRYIETWFNITDQSRWSDVDSVLLTTK